MTKKRTSQGLFLGMLVALGFPAACGSSGVVGGHCRANYIECDGRCVDAQNDPAHCGTCSNSCDSETTCERAMCVAREGGAGDAGSSGNMAGAGGTSNAGAGGALGQAGEGGEAATAGTAGEAGAANCTPPFDRPEHCGSCGHRCQAPTANCTPDGAGSFECVASCSEPLVECNGQCVDPPPYDTPARCGTCDNDCGGSTPLCEPDGMGSYQCVSVCDSPLVLCNGKCVDPPPYDTAQACGACDNVCADPTPACSPDGKGSYKCVKVCDPPLTLCADQCVDENIDADHCGSCNNVCPSGICQAGMCVGANVGHEVLACMDYSQPTQTAPQTVLLGNTLFLPVRNPVRIMAYTEFAPAAVRAKVNQAIGYAATARGRTYAITPIAKSTDVTAQLNIGQFDVFLVYDQSTAPAGTLATIGGAWQTSTVLSSFAAAGGVIVVLSSTTGTGEMPQLLSASQLLDVSAQTDVTGAQLYNRAPADAVGINVISPFLSQKNTCNFTTTLTPDADNIFVVSDTKAPAAGAPVVVHRVIEP